MSNIFLGIIIAGTGLLALYWVFYGQRKYNEMVLPERKTELKAILFDLDGVIIDSFEPWFNIFNELRRTKGLGEMSKQEFLKKVWGGSPANDTKLLNTAPEEIEKSYKELYKKHVYKSKLLPNAREVLSKIREKKYKIGLVTNTYHENVELTLKHHHIKEVFDVVIAGDQIENPKPYPDAILKACEKLNVMPEEILYIGDTKIDYKAGKAAGCVVVGLNTKGDLMISKLDDLMEMI